MLLIAILCCISSKFTVYFKYNVLYFQKTLRSTHNYFTISFNDTSLESLDNNINYKDFRYMLNGSGRI